MSGGDRDDGDKRQDQRVLGQALAILVAAKQEVDHCDGPPLVCWFPV